MDMHELELPIDRLTIIGRREHIDRYKKNLEQLNQRYSATRYTLRQERERLRRWKRRTYLLAITAAALTVALAVFMTAGSKAVDASAPTKDTSGPSETMAEISPKVTYDPLVLDWTSPEGDNTPAAEPTPSLLLESVPLTADQQNTIFDLCGWEPERFCAIMAIANKESRFDPEAVGDGGKSIGMMQINTKAQAQRISNLGITDLTDIEQGVTVALDYIDWIMDHMDGAAFDSHRLYMAYNMGLQGAKENLAAGYTSSSYSREVLEIYQGYLAEIGG